MSDLFQIFLAHAREDKEQVIKISDRLREKGYTPWLEEKDILAGQNIEQEINNAIKNSDLFIACLSNKSVNQNGSIYKQLRLGLEKSARQVVGQIYLIPLRLDDCQIPELERINLGINLQNFHYLDVWEEGWFEKLIKAIDAAINQLRQCQDLITFKNQKYLQNSTIKNQYFQNIIAIHKDYKTYGLKTRGPFTLDLNEVFVPLRLAPECFDKISSDILKTEAKMGHLSIWSFINKNKTHINSFVEPFYRTIAIIGPPGSGKTTLLQHLSLTYAEKGLKEESSNLQLFPILLSLKEKEVGETIASENIDLLEIIKRQELIKRLKAPEQWIESELNNGNSLVLLDGLDEIGSKQNRKQVSLWLQKQIINYPNVRFIITSRPFGYRDAPVESINVILEVQPFNLEQMQDFIYNWYLQSEIMSRLGEDNVIIREQAKTKSDNLIKSIKNNSALVAMALNPLLLTMIATVHCYRGILPKRRVELFAEICDVLLGKRQEAKGVLQNLTSDQKKAILQGLALKLMQERKRQFTLEEGEILIKGELDKLSNVKIKSKNFIEEIETLSGLLVEKEQGIYEFAHFNFQEYLAAAQIKESSLAYFPKFVLNKILLLPLSSILYRIIIKTLKRNSVLTKEIIDDPWWYETICLYAAISDATYLIQAALIKSDLVSLNLALDCVDQGLKVSREVREEVIAKLEQGLESSNSEIFKLAVEVKLARRFKNLLRLDDNLKIDTNYITAAEYKFYLNECGDRDKSYLRNFNNKKAKQPIKELSWEDSLEFCAWLTSKASSFQFDKTEQTWIDYYRLPTTKENNDNPILGNEKLESWTIKNENSSQAKSIRIVKVSIDSKYTNLINLLAAEEWKKADLETTNLIKKEVRCEDSDNLDIDNIQEITSEMLSTIDRLWMIYSGGSYGLGVQTKIWKTNRNNSFVGCLPSSWCINNFEYKEFLQLLNQKFYDSQIERCEIKNSLLSQIITTYPLEFQTIKLNDRGKEIQKSTVKNTYFCEDLGNGISLDLVLIPDGSFRMGAPEQELESDNYERPQHQVNVSSFFMGRYPITQAQWKAVAQWDKVERNLDPDPSRFKGNYKGITRWNRPVEQVNWDDAIEFCKRLSNKTKREYRLPSEAQWEYACRAATTTPFHFGETISAELANYEGNYTYGQGVKGEYRKQTTPVGYFKVANNFGLYDMHGNVREWCEDDWHFNYQNAPDDGTAWISRKSNTKVVRGGSWCGIPFSCRSAYRYSFLPGSRDDNIGFRVVRLAPRTS